MNNFDWLQSYYDSLPRPLRRRWRYRQWDRIHWEFFCRQIGSLSERYIEMLDFGIRNRLKIFFTPQLPNYTGIVQLWNMAQVSHLKLLPFDSNLKLRSHNREKQLRQWLDEMFLPYRLPEWCYAQWKILQSSEAVEKLVWLGRGESPRKLFGLSKGELSLFGRPQPEMPSLYSCCIYLAGLSQGCSGRVSAELAKAWPVRKIGEFPEILQFARPVAEWLVRRKVPVWHVRPLGEYLFQERFPEAGFSLKGRTLSGLQREIDDWHFQLFGYRRNADSWKTYGLSAVLKKSGITFEELHDAASLREEGKRLHHCVGRYFGACLRGKSAIVSMRSPSGEIDLTLEISPVNHSIVQIRGKRNQLPSPEAFEYICKYADSKQLELAV